VDPNTVLGWLREAADQLQAFSRYCLCEVHLRQVQLDELYAVLRDVKNGEISADTAIKRLERSRHWVWTALDPESQLLVVIDLGPRTLAMAEGVVHHVAQILAPDLCTSVSDRRAHGVSDGVTDPLRALGATATPADTRSSAQAPVEAAATQLLYAQVVKSYRRRRLVAVKHQVGFGTMERVKQVLSACGWQTIRSLLKG
jgi:hypothetical protein